MSDTSAMAWRRLSPALLLLWMAVAWCWWDALQGMVGIWMRSDTFAHAFLVLPISLWLSWQRRQTLRQLTPAPSPLMLAPMAAVALLWLMGALAAANALTQLALVAMLALSVPAMLGIRVGRVLAFPLLFLFFAVPLGEFMVPQLMEWTADFTVLALRLSGIPVFREGLSFVIPSGHWSVVEACSGVRYMIASAMVGTLFGYLNYRSMRKRLLFVGVSLLVPLAANWLRAYLIVLLGHLSSNRLAAGADHLVYGWLFFGVIMALMFMIGARWAEPQSDRAALPLSPAADRPTTGAGAWPVALAAVLLVLLPTLMHDSIEHAGAARRPVLAALTSTAPAWVSDSPVGEAWTPGLQNPAATLRQHFHKGNDSVGLYLAYYRQQGADSKLVSTSNQWLTEGPLAWTQLRAGSQLLTWHGDKSIKLNTAVLRAPGQTDGRPGQELLVWQLYWVNGRWTASDIEAKAWGAMTRLLGRGDDAANLFFYSSNAAGVDADAILATFVRENLNLIESQLRATRDSGADKQPK